MKIWLYHQDCHHALTQTYYDNCAVTISLALKLWVFCPYLTAITGSWFRGIIHACTLTANCTDGTIRLVVGEDYEYYYPKILDLHWHQIHFILPSPQTIASPAIGADYNSISTLVSFSGGDGPLTLSQPPIQIAIIDDNNVNWQRLLTSESLV